jgi:hypothetical protein
MQETIIFIICQIIVSEIHFCNKQYIVYTKSSHTTYGMQVLDEIEILSKGLVTCIN